MLVPIDLTRGAIKMLLSDQAPKNFKPVVQVIDVRLVETENQNNSHEKYWIWLSDGSFVHEGILAYQMNDLVRDGKLQKSSIVMLTQFSMCELIQKEMIIVIIDLGVILEKCLLVGKPRRYPTEIDGNVPSPVQSMNEPLSVTIAQSYGCGSSMDVSAPISSVSRDTGLDKTYVRKSIKQIEDKILGISKEPDWIQVCARITSVDTYNFCYPSCLNTGDRQSGIMVTNDIDGKWRCDECDQVFDKCDYQYRLRIQIQDQTGSTWVTAFQETGEEIMGISAKDLYNMKQDKETEEEFYQLVKKVLYTEFMFKLIVKEVPVNDEHWAVELTIVKMEKVSFGTETKYLQPDETAKHNEDDAGSLPPKNEPAVNYVNTPRETGASASPVVSCGGIASGKCDECHEMVPKF